MLIDVRSNDCLVPRAIDIYPGIDDDTQAAHTVRFTVLLNGEIYFRGVEWTPERMQQEWQRAQDLQEAFDVALAIVEAEKGA